jgi:hypothetical protein
MTEQHPSTHQIGLVPASISDPDVRAFIHIYSLEAKPVYLRYKNFGYGPDWCHVSAKHRALKHEGRRVHGWAIWQFNGLALGDFHSVWETREGELVDVTPPKFGADRVLFVRDDSCKIEEENGQYLIHVSRSSNPNEPFYWDGKPTQFTHWPLLPSNPHLVAYCNKLEISVSQILTTEQLG